jgi:Fis family transcriptional regulator
MSSNDLADCVRRTLNRYFRDLEDEKPTGIYDMVLQNVERSMLETILARADGNQTVAAEMLGINRNTLRRKLTEYELL